MSSSIPIYMSSGLYVPVHKRNRSTSSSYSSASPSPLSSRGSSPLPSTSHHGVYTPAELLSLADSPLTRASEGDMDTRLRTIAPEVVQTRKQRKTLAWHARHALTPAGRERLPRGHSTSELDDDGMTWRRA